MALSVDFSKSLDRCRTGLRASWRREAVATLDADDLFAETEISELLGGEGDDWAAATEERFGKHERRVAPHRIELGEEAVTEVRIDVGKARGIDAVKFVGPKCGKPDRNETGDHADQPKRSNEDVGSSGLVQEPSTSSG